MASIKAAVPKEHFKPRLVQFYSSKLSSESLNGKQKVTTVGDEIFLKC